jgi:enoyl-CoA hydratase
MLQVNSLKGDKGMGLENVVLEKEKQVARIVLNRPDKFNALDAKTYDELWIVTEDVRTDKDVRVVIITGRGRGFCAGVDLKYAATINGMTMSELKTTIRKVQETFRLERLEKPVIAAVNGYALGNGCDLAIACDFRIASETARLQMTYTQLGLIPDAGSTCRLARLVGVSKAKGLIFTGDMIDAKEAERIGLLDRVVPAQQLESVTMEFARKLARGAPVAMGFAKIAIHHALDTDLNSALEFETNMQALCFQTEDVKEGIMAKLQKREPNFRGK